MGRHIVTISGGGFSNEENADIDTYVLDTTKKTYKKNVGFVATASHAAKGYIENFYKHLIMNIQLI